MIKRIVLFSAIVCLLTSCTTPENWKNSGAPAVNEIDSAMSHALSDNTALEKNSGAPMSHDIANALLPGLNLDSADEEPLERFDVSVNNMPLTTLLLVLTKDTPYNILVDPKANGNVTLHLKQVTVPEVLDALQEAYGYEYEVENFGIYITKGGMQTRTFRVHYLNIQRDGNSRTVISSGQPTQTTNTTTDEAAEKSTSSSASNSTVSQVKTRSASDFWTILTTTVSAIVGSETPVITTDTKTAENAEANTEVATSTMIKPRVIVNPAAGLVMVTASPKIIHEVATYLDEVQSAVTQQVMIEAKILEVALSKDYQAGIDWSILGASQNGTESITGNDNLNAFTNLFALNVSNGGMFSTAINLLSTQGNVQVLSSPRITTLNNQKALIKVGKDQYYITNISNTVTSNSSSSTDNTQDVEITPFFSGIALDVTPEISSANEILLHIHPIVSRVTSSTLEYTVNGTDQSIPSALSEIKETDNLVKAQSGQIVVIGGLMENTTKEYLASTPFADKVPFVGSMFRKTNQTSVNSELVILLKPIIVNNGALNTHLKDLSEQFKRLKRGYHFGNFPERFGNIAEYEKNQ